MYFCCVFTDPGKVPSGWLPDSEGGAFVEVKKKVRQGDARLACSPLTSLAVAGRRGEVLQQMHRAQAAPHSPLSPLRPLHPAYGPPLLVGE